MRIGFAIATILASLFAVTHSARASVASTAAFSRSQATAGHDIYEARCSACHGEHLHGVVGPALAGNGSIVKGKTVGSIFSFITKNMPLNAAGSLSHVEYTEIMAYILRENGHHASTAALDFGGAQRSSTRI